MKRIKLGIKTSTHQNYTYHVYRSTRQQDLPSNLETLNSLYPLMVVNESLLQKDATNIDEIVIPDKTKAPRSLKTPYKLSYEPLLSSIHPLQIVIKDVTTLSTVGFMCEFNNSGNVVSITKTTNDGTDITEEIVPNTTIEFIDDNIYIPESYLITEVEITCNYYIQVVNIYDDNDKITDGIDYNGPVATGLATPVVNKDIEQYPVAVDSNLPVLSIRCNGSDQGVLYYYRVVAEDTLGNVSEPSPLFSMVLSQLPANITYRLEGTFDYGVLAEEEVVWDSLVTNALHNTEYEIGKPSTELFESIGLPVSDVVPKFDGTSLNINTNYVHTDNTIEITIPNVWKETTPIYNRRKTMSLRAIARDMFGNISAVSAIREGTSELIPIERITLLRKTISGEVNIPENVLPIDINDANATILKEWIRTDGRYYDVAEHTGYPENLQLTNAPVCLMTFLSTFDTLITVDDNAQSNQVYNYTIVISDVYGNHSSLNKIIDTTITP